MPDDNAAVLQHAVDAINKKGQVASFFGGDFARHAEGNAKGIQTAFPDLEYKIDHVHAEGDHVTFAYTATGTNKGALGPHKATGKKATWQGSGTATISGGKITAVHLTEDFRRAALQLGIIHLLNPSMTGKWSGSAQGITVTMNLVQTGNNVIGTATATGFSAPFPVSGTNNYPNVSLNGNVGGLGVNFTGTFSNPNTIPGKLTVQDFPPIQVTITRQ